MNTGFDKARSVPHCVAAIAVTLSLASMSSQGQTGNTSYGTRALKSTTGGYNTAIGYEALQPNTTGENNTAIGYETMGSNTTGIQNTATGIRALGYNTTGNYNTANGFYALLLNTTGSYNTANGYKALGQNTITGDYNTANGAFALFANSTGIKNTANGSIALYQNTSGSNNTANGYQSLYTNDTGNTNTANGYQSLYSNTTGSNNTANGAYTLFSNTTGEGNIANGYQSLYYNTIGGLNIANGSYSLFSNTTGNGNTANGLFALYSNTTGSSNIGVGYGAGQYLTTGSSNIIIGHFGTASDNKVIRIGTPGTQQATFIAGINGVTPSGGVAVYINANGQLGTLTSSARFKYDIRHLGTTSDKLMDLRPVSFRYKEATADGLHPLQYGLIAEEVAKVYPDMVQYDKEGKPFTVYYQQLTPMMLNELQKAHHRAEVQEAEIGELRSELTALRQSLQQKQTAEGKPTGQTQTPFIFSALALIACVSAAFVPVEYAHLDDRGISQPVEPRR